MEKAYKKLIKKGIYIDKEIIRFNVDMQSLIQLRLEKDDIKSADLMSTFLQEVQTDKTNKYMQLMASMPVFLEKETTFPSAFEMFSDMKADESSSESDADSEDSDDHMKREKAVPVRFRIEIPGRITAEHELPSSLNEDLRCSHQII